MPCIIHLHALPLRVYLIALHNEFSAFELLKFPWRPFCSHKDAAGSRELPRHPSVNTSCRS